MTEAIDEPRGVYEPDKESTPEVETEVIHSWITPKTKILNKKAYAFHNDIVNPLNRDLTTSFLDQSRQDIVDEYLSLYNDALAFAEISDENINDFINFVARDISFLVNSSKGADKGNLLKIIKTQWAIKEEKKEEKIDQTERYKQLSDEKEKRWGFL